MNSQEVTKSRRFSPVMQFSIYSENKVGRLNEIANIFAANQIHILAVSTVDNTECSIIRLIVDYPEQASALMEENNITFSRIDVVAVEMVSEANLKRITSALVEAEININYLYPFLMRPHGRSGLVIRSEDNELAVEILRMHQVVILSQEDIAR